MNRVVGRRIHIRRSLAAALLALLLAVACSSDEPSSVSALGGPLRRNTIVEGEVFSFVVIGNFGTDDPEARDVARAVEDWARRRPVEAVVTTGDNVYEDGHPSEFEQAWLEPYGWVEEAGIPVVASLGNHDVRTRGGEPVMQLFSMPGPWYAHRFGPVEFFVLDTTRRTDPRQLEFLAASLRRSEAAWQVGVFHHPAYSCSPPGSTPLIQLVWVPLLRAGGADLVLSGHHHNYQRFPPIRDMVFVVSAGAGRQLHDIEECPAGTPEPVAALDDAHHFLYVRATQTNLTITAVVVPGNRVVDRTVIRQRAGAGADAADSVFSSSSGARIDTGAR